MKVLSYLAISLGFGSAFLYFYYSDFLTYHHNLVDALSALLVPAIAIFGVFIAHRQSQISSEQRQIAHNKLRLDLFDRRFAIYDATRTLISKVRGGNIRMDTTIAFRSAVRDAQWFLNDDIHNYLNNTMYSIALDLEETERSLEAEWPHEEKIRLVAIRKEKRNWILDQDKVIDEKFSPYLRFRLEK